MTTPGEAVNYLTREFGISSNGVPEGFRDVSAQGFDDMTSNRDSQAEPEGLGSFSAPDGLPTFPTEVFAEPVRQYISQSARTIGIAPDFIGLPLIAYIAGVMGNSHFLHVKHGWDIYPSFWTCVIAETGTGKTPGGEKARDPVNDLQASAWDGFEQDLAEYEDDIRRAKIDPTLEVRSQPHMEQFLTSDITTEAIADALQYGTGLTVTKDELLGWVLQFDAYRSGGKGSDRQSYMSMWSNSDLKIDRKSKPSIIISKPVVNVTGGIQPGQLDRLEDEVSEGDGFLARFLFSFLDDARPPRWTDEELSPELRERVVELIGSLRRPMSEEPRGVRLSDSALFEFKSWSDENADAQIGAHSFVRALFAKFPQHCGRIALLLHCLDNPVYPSSVDLSKSTMMAAITLTEYFRAHALCVAEYFGAGGFTPPTDLTGLRAKVFNAVQRDGPEWVTRGTINKRTGRASAESKKTTLDELVASGYLEHRNVPTDSARGGRPTETYRVSPAVTPTTPDPNVIGVKSTP